MLCFLPKPLCWQMQKQGWLRPFIRTVQIICIIALYWKIFCTGVLTTAWYRSSIVTARLGGVGLGIWVMGKLGRAWVGAWVCAWVVLLWGGYYRKDTEHFFNVGPLKEDIFSGHKCSDVIYLAMCNLLLCTYLCCITITCK